MYPCFSNDGKQIVFARAHRYRPYSMGGWTWDDWDIYTVKVDGTELRRITHRRYYQIVTPRFSPDGRFIFFSAIEQYGSTNSGSMGFAVDAEGGTPREVTPADGRNVGCAAWGSWLDIFPDGERIVCVSDRGQPFFYEIYLIGLRNKSATPLGATKISRYNQNPVVVSGGQKIVFLAAREFDSSSLPIFSLWSYDTESTKISQLADRKLFDDPIGWMERERGSPQRQGKGSGK